MPVPKLTALVIFLALAVSAVVLPSRLAEGDAKRELADTVKKGQALWTKQWKRGAKSCSVCHDKGPNKMIGSRLNAWPKYDKYLKKVATGQEKIVQMIQKMSMGPELELGHEDVTALEAYIKTR